MPENRLTTISARPETVERLREFGHFGETWDDLLSRLANQCDNQNRVDIH